MLTAKDGEYDEAEGLDSGADDYFASDVAPNLVEVYISALRRKIDTPFARRNITTVRGVGYRLTANDKVAGHAEFS